MNGQVCNIIEIHKESLLNLSEIKEENTGRYIDYYISDEAWNYETSSFLFLAIVKETRDHFYILTKDEEE